MYSDNQDFNYPAFDKRNPPGPGFIEHMDVSPIGPNQSAQQMYGPSAPPRSRMNETGYFNPNNPGFPNTFSQTDQYVFDPMVANFAMQYGSKLVDTGKDMVDKRIGKYVALNALKYYFSVDTQYVLKKLRLILFPFANKEWCLKYQSDGPMPPRQDVNAPDLYIPLMGYVTYVLVTGVILGLQDRFSPEVLGVISSQALAWVLLELLVHSVTLYVTNIHTKLKLLDLLAFIGYKFFSVILCIACGMIFREPGYYISIIYCSLSLAFYLMRALRQHILHYPEDYQDNVGYTTTVRYPSGRKRGLYFLFFAGLSQPVLIWFLSRHITY